MPVAAEWRAFCTLKARVTAGDNEARWSFLQWRDSLEKKFLFRERVQNVRTALGRAPAVACLAQCWTDPQNLHFFQHDSCVKLLEPESSSTMDASMSTTIRAYVPADFLPDAETMLRQIRVIEPTFAFVNGFDPSETVGLLACSIKGVGGRLEWRYALCDAVPEELEGRHLDYVAEATYQSPSEACCAALVIGQIVGYSGGVLETPDRKLLETSKAGRWVRDRLRSPRAASRASRASPSTDAPDPQLLLAKAHAAFPGARMTRLMRSLPDDPNVSIRFDRGVGFSARRWTLMPDGLPPMSTRDLPRIMSGTDQLKLAKALDELISILKAEPVHSTSLDRKNLELHIRLSSATLVLHPRAGSYPTRDDQLFAINDRWDLFTDEGWLYPDAGAGRLASKPARPS